MKRRICKKIRGLAEGYHLKTLDTGPVLQVEAHLSECPSCRKAYLEIREVLTLLKEDVLPDPGPAFWNELNSRILTQVRLARSEGDEDPWYKKFRIKPFGRAGYAWATALLLMLLTPVLLYNITFQGNHRPSIQENIDQENKWETRPLPLPVVVENLSDTESVHLAKRVMARMGKDWPSSTGLLMNEDLHWDIFRSLEGLNKQELEALINKIGPGGSAGNKEEGEYVC
jgi:predicted anti-sigma-YlaC factor YlaD